MGRITRDAVDYIGRNYLKETVVKHPDRPEAERFWNYPLAAIEEAVVNAVYHRSYEIREPIEVRLTPEELVVLSFPGPDRSIQLRDLQAGRAVSRRYRNRRIGEFLKELNLTEGRSTGVPKILRVMKTNGSPAPVFETDDDRSYFLIRLPVHDPKKRS
ncbi:MAG: ATP-binding protein [Legionellaceae bacterium]|nr:ATP-binding protein [Legionellaceae bacterium]